MDDAGQTSPAKGTTEIVPGELGHPRGTLVIVFLFGLLFGLGWLFTYLFLFLERGSPHP